MANYTLAGARAAMDAGDLRLAESLLPTTLGADVEVSCLKCEILFVRGSIYGARKLATELAGRVAPDSREVAKLKFIAGASTWELGNDVQ